MLLLLFLCFFDCKLIKKRKMLIEKEIFEKLCPSFQNVIQKLEEKYTEISEENYVEKLELLKEYFHQYLMLPGIWDKYYFLLTEYQWTAVENNEEFGNLMIKTWKEKEYGSRISAYHLNEDKTISAVPPKLLHKIAKYFHGNPHKGPFTLKEIEAALIRPQKGMDRTLRFFEEYSCDPIPKNVIEKYQKAQKLYEEIVEAENEQQKWFNLLIKCEAKEYVCDNIESRIGRNLNNIELWNLYFDFLKQDKCKKRLLHLYSRYCRYFLDNFKMKKEYKEAAKKNGAIKVFWKNAFDFEIYETNINLIISDSGHLILNSEKTIDSKNESVSKNIKKPSFGTYKIQIFSFPKTFMAYILENVSPNILRKLQKSCKYFFILQPYPICHKFLRVSESDNIKFNGHSIQISNNFYDESSEIFNNKFILSNSYLVSPELFLSKIYQCHAKYIRIWSIKLGITLKEFKFLVGHGNVEVLDLSDAPIINEDKTPVALEEILKILPKIIEFTHVCSSPLTAPQPFCTTPRTFEILPTLKFSNKIQFFHIYYVTYFESIGFCEFLKKNIISTSEVSVGFGPRMDLNEAEKLGKEVETELNDFDWPGNEKPLIRVAKPYSRQD